MEAIIELFLLVLGLYFLLGFLFGLYFLFGGAVKVDPLMGDSKWIVRLLLFPGCIAVWPFLVFNLIRSKNKSI